MANYNGVISSIDNISAIPPEWQYTEYLIQDLFNPGTAINDDFSKAGTIALHKFVPKISVFNGAKASDYSNIFYNNLWFTPESISLGLINKDMDYSVYVFNSYSVAKTLNSIVNTVSQSNIATGTLPTT